MLLSGGYWTHVEKLRCRRKCRRAQRQRLDRVLEIHQAFTQVVLATGGIPKIASLLFELLGRPVAFIDEDAGAPLDDDQLLALQRAAVAIAIRLVLARAAGNELDRFAQRSLEELISGRASNPTDVAERAISFGWDLTRRRAVLLASTEPSETSR